MALCSGSRAGHHEADSHLCLIVCFFSLPLHSQSATGWGGPSDLDWARGVAWGEGWRGWEIISLSKKTTTRGARRDTLPLLSGRGTGGGGGERGATLREFSFTLQIMPNLRALRFYWDGKLCKSAFLNEGIYINTCMCNHIKYFKVYLLNFDFILVILGFSF